ncbi:MAG TPA: M48 family metalloprotease [Pyrinomonadaceae bacterium]|nr:M48 family metalloprotease [Pyrinomonadaceae bacterium]
MNRPRLISLLALFVGIIFSIVAAEKSAAISTHKPSVRTGISVTQFDDPYSDFRNVRHSNAGLLNERDEIKLGAQLHREVTKKYNLTDVGLERIERLGQRCARASVRPNILYKFHVVQMKEINGFSLPGGHVYITTALLKMANDNELASVLCHEVGHIAARHSLKTLKKRQQYNDIAKSIGELTGVAGDIGRDVGVTLGQIVGEGLLTFHSQDEEREADFLGVRDMAKAGFDPQGMITMFQKLQKIENQNPDLLGSLFSDHPDAQERIDNTRYEITRMKGQNRLR